MFCAGSLDLAHLEARGRVGHQLHQALGVLRRDGPGVEVGFGGHHRQHQLRRQLVLGCDQVDEAHDRLRRIGRRGQGAAAAGRRRAGCGLGGSGSSRSGAGSVSGGRKQAGGAPRGVPIAGQHVLRLHHALLGRGGKQVRGLGIVALDAARVGQHPGQAVLRLRVAIAGRAAVQLRRADRVARHAVAMFVGQRFLAPALHLGRHDRARSRAVASTAAATTRASVSAPARWPRPHKHASSQRDAQRCRRRLDRAAMWIGHGR